MDSTVIILLAFWAAYFGVGFTLGIIHSNDPDFYMADWVISWPLMLWEKM